MMAHSHVVFGLALWTGVAALHGAPAGGPIDLGLVVIGSLLPDIDHPSSWFGRRLPFISWPLAALVGHRGVTHSGLAIAAWAAAIAACGSSLWLGPLAVGYLSHVLGDCLTPSGVPMLWPSRRRFRIPLFRTNSLAEHVSIGVVAVGLVHHSGLLGSMDGVAGALR
jgi:inner membrane protein